MKMKNKILTISTLSLLSILTACGGGGGGGGGSSSGNNNSGDGGSNSNGGNNSNFTYFIPFSDNGSGLWKTNGTINGSSKIADVKNNTQFVVLGDTVFYIEKLESNKSTPIPNGKNNSVLKRIKNGVTTTIHGDESQISHLTKAGKYVYFAEMNKDADGYFQIKFWVTDENSSPKQIPNSPTIGRSSINELSENFVALGDSIYYHLPKYLYVSSYTDTQEVTSSDLSDNLYSSLITHDGYLYFTTTTLDTNAAGYSVFKTNGANAEKLSTQGGFLSNGKIVFVGNKPYFFSTDPSPSIADLSYDYDNSNNLVGPYANATFMRGLMFQTETMQNGNHALAYDNLEWGSNAYRLYDKSTNILSYEYINDTIIMEDATNIIATNLDGKFVKIDSNCGTDIRDIVGHDANNIYFMKDYKLYKSAGLKVVNGNASFTCELLKDDTLNMPSER